MASIAYDITLFQGTTDPPLTDTIEYAGAVVDLTGATVKLRMRLASSSTLKVDAAATVVSAANGTVSYAWQNADVDTVGNYRAWWHVTFAGGATQDTPEFNIKILPHAATTGDLCTVFDVREAMNLPAISTGSDDQIQEFITEASELFVRITDRQFTQDPAVDIASTRRFKVRGYRVDFYPWDLQTITSVVLRPESGGQVLSLPTATTPDVEMSPFQKRDGVWTSMKISPLIVVTSAVSVRFGYVYCDVTGDWGMPSVPVPIKRACVMTVRSWLRKDASTYSGVPGSQASDHQPVAQGTYDVPYAAMKILNRYKRWPGII
jgi:hypothetical protein